MTGVASEEKQQQSFERLFNPRAIAIFGVNKAPYGGSYFLRCLQKANFPNPIYPVNPNLAGENLFGAKVLGSAADFPDTPPVDLAIVAVPAKACPSVLEDLGRARVPFVHIFTSGFSEVGNLELERKLVSVAREWGLRIVGPNCMGAYNPAARVVFADDLTDQSGHVAFISQSGGLAARLAINGASRGYFFSKIISVGNQADLNLNDFFRYFGTDPDTTVVSAYLENIKHNGKDLVSLLKDITPCKPVVIWKGGMSERGSRAVMSHTGGLAGNYRLWEAMARQTGATLVQSFDELTEMNHAFSTYPLPETLGVAVITAGGGQSVEATDACERLGLQVPELSQTAQDQLGRIFPDVNTNLQNPLDLGAMGLMADTYGKAIEVIGQEPEISSVIFVKDPERFPVYARNFGVENFMEVFVETTAKAVPPGKLVMSVAATLEEEETAALARFRFQELLQEKGIMSFKTIEAAAKVIYHMWTYRNYLDKRKKWELKK